MTTRLAFLCIGPNRRFVADSARLSVALLAAVVIVVATPAVGGDAIGPAPTSTGLAQERMVGVFTGEFVNGTPVYRLPSISVSASRTADLAKIEREERLTRARQARTRTPARPPA